MDRPNGISRTELLKDLQCMALCQATEARRLRGTDRIIADARVDAVQRAIVELAQELSV